MEGQAQKKALADALENVLRQDVVNEDDLFGDSSDVIMPLHEDI